MNLRFTKIDAFLRSATKAALLLCGAFCFVNVHASDTDWEKLHNCVKNPTEGCEKADVDNNGVIDNADIDLYRYRLAVGDFDGNGSIFTSDEADLGQLLRCQDQSALGQCSRFDMNVDGRIDQGDIEQFNSLKNLGDIDGDGKITLGLPQYSEDLAFLDECMRIIGVMGVPDPSCPTSSITYRAEIAQAIPYDLNLDGRIELDLSQQTGDLLILFECWYASLKNLPVLDQYPQCDINRDSIIDSSDIINYVSFLRNTPLDLNGDNVVDLRSKMKMPVHISLDSSSLLVRSGYQFAIKMNRTGPNPYKKIYVWVPVDDNRTVSYKLGHRPKGVDRQHVLFGDLNRDNTVNAKDLDLLHERIDEVQPYDGYYDLNGNGIVGTDDISFLEKNLLYKFRQAMLLDVTAQDNPGPQMIEIFADDGANPPSRTLLHYMVNDPRDVVTDAYDDVMVVVNDNSPDSIQIGEYFVTARNIPLSNVVHIRAPVQETVSREVYESDILSPIQAALQKDLGDADINYVLTTKGVPLRVGGLGTAPGVKTESTKYEKVRASVDSLLSTDILDGPQRLDSPWKQCWGRGASTECPIDGPYNNPYFGHMFPFSSKRYGYHIVTRLTAYTAQEVIEMIDKAQYAHESADGTYVFDADPGKSGVLGVVDDMIIRAAEVLQGAGKNAHLDDSKEYLTHISNVLGYVSWGSNDCCDSTEPYPGFTGFQWLPGSIATTFVSTSARSFHAPMTYGQSTVADMLREGVTSAAGFAFEPYADALVKPQVLFTCYASGLRSADCIYAASPFLGWQEVVVGDPKMRLTDKVVW